LNTWDLQSFFAVQFIGGDNCFLNPVFFNGPAPAGRQFFNYQLPIINDQLEGVFIYTLLTSTLISASIFFDVTLFK
jgi:hypothetical protein